MEYRIYCRIICRNLLISISLLLTISILSCGFWDFSEPEIVTIDPAQNQSYAGTNGITNLSVLFSARMNHFTVENSVQLKKINKAHFDEETISGDFQWMESGLLQEKIIFIPKELLTFGKYRLDIAADCEDMEGNNLHHDTNIYFQIGSDTTPPELISIHPLDGAINISNDQNILLSFDEPIDINSLPQLFNLDPGESYYIYASSNNTRFELVLLDKMSPGLHTLSISDIRDVYGNPWQEDKNTYFTVGNDFLSPEFNGMYSNTNAPAFVTNAVNTLDKYQDLWFAFSEEMDIDVDSVPISFNPAIAGTWTLSSNRLHFVPAESWDINTHYSVTIKQGFKDKAGNVSASSYNYQLLISSPQSYFIDYVQIKALTNILNPLAINKILVTNLITNDSSMDFHIQLNSPLKDYSVLENVGVSYISGSGTLVSPYISTMIFSNAVHLKDSVILRIKDISYYNLYKLTIKGGRDKIEDTNGNWIKEDIEVYFRPEQ